ADARIQVQQTRPVRLAAEKAGAHEQQVVIALSRSVREEELFAEPIDEYGCRVSGVGCRAGAVRGDGLAQSLGEIGVATRPGEDTIEQCPRGFLARSIAPSLSRESQGERRRLGFVEVI